MKTNLLKSIFISLILVMGVSNAWAADASNAIVYYDNTASNWSDVQILIGRSTWSSVYTLSKISGTNNLYCKTSLSWGSYSEFYFVTGASSWGDEGNSPTHRTGYVTNYSAKKTTSLGSNKYLYVSSGTSEGASLTETKLNNGYSDLNYTQTVQQHLSTDGGTNYSASTAALATVKVSSNKLNGNSSTTSSSGTIASGSSSATCSAARTATVTYTVTDVKSGYTFVGWYDGTTQKSTATTYNALKATGAKTITARFQKNATNSLTVKAGEGIASVTGSKDPVTLNSTYPITATPKTGYTFTTWTADPSANATFENASSASTNVTVKNGAVTVTATATENLHAITVQSSNNNHGTVTKSADKAGIATSITITATAQTNLGYVFDHWELSDGITITSGDENSATIQIKATKAGSLTAHFRGENRPQNVYLIGTMNKWKESDAEWRFYKLPGESGNTVTLTKTIDKSDYHNDGYKFGINIYQSGWGDKWWKNSSSNDTKMDAHNCTGWGFNTKDGDKRTYIDLNVSGEYTFTLTNANSSSQQKLSITYPDKSFIEGDFATAWDEDAYPLTENGDIQTVTIPITSKTDIQFRLVSHGKLFGTGTKILIGSNSQTLSEKNMESDGAVMTIGAYVEGDYVFSYNKSTKVLTVTYPSVSQLQIYSANPAHDAVKKNWDWDSQNGDVYTKTLSLNANTDYTFKAVINSAFYGKTTTLNRVNSSAALNTSGGNVTLSTDIAGDYIFTFNASNNQLTVTYPSKLTLTDGPTTSVSSATTSNPLTTVPGQTITATPTITSTGTKAFCWGLYTDAECTDGNKVDNITFTSLGAGKVSFALPEVEKTYYLKLTIHPDADCKQDPEETIIAPINATTEKFIFFKKNISASKWNNVYVNFYNGKYWDSQGKGSGNSNNMKSANNKMTQIKGTNIFYFNYSGITPGNVVSFVNNSGDYDNFYWCQVVYREDMDLDCAPMFVSRDYIQSDNYINDSEYYDGYWTTFAPDVDAKHNICIGNTSYKLESATPTRTYTLTQELSANTTVHFYLQNACYATTDYGYYGTYGEMDVKNCTNWVMYHNDNNIALKTRSAGEYTFIVSFLDNGEIRVSVEYPLMEGDYQLIYKDSDNRPHPSDYVRNRANGEDIVSLYINKEKSPTVTLQQWDGNKWNVKKGLNNQPITVDLSPITDDGTMTSGVYNFKITQPAEEDITSNEAIEVQGRYLGYYYIRTNSAEGKWKTYKMDSHKMTYSAYADENEGFTHYFCEFLGDNKSGSEDFIGTHDDDISFAIACDYAKALTDTLEGDTYTNGLNLYESASVRFMYNTHTNGLRRAYLKGRHESTDYLKLTKGEGNMTLNEGGEPINEITFNDEGNWIYSIDVYVTPVQINDAYTFSGTLTAKYPINTVLSLNTQYFYATPGQDTNSDGIPDSYSHKQIIGGSDGAQLKVAIRYDFKTNRLMRAWKPTDEITNDLPITADILLIRKGQDAATQINLSSETEITDVQTIYGAIQFDYNDVVGKVTSWNSHAYEFGRYYLSFPFDVAVSDIFGFGTLNENWQIQRYNGQKRADIGWFAETSTFWEPMQETEVMNANEGYILALDRKTLNGDNNVMWQNKEAGSSVYLYFPSSSATKTIANGTQTIKVPEHKCNIDREFQVENGTKTVNHQNTDSHWNVIGSPLFENKVATRIAEGPETEHPDDVYPAETKLRYFYKWQYEEGKENTYAVSAAFNTEHAFLTMHGYMVQYAGDVTFEGASITPPASVAARRVAENKQNYTVELQLHNEDIEASRTYVELRENAIDSFLLSEDLYMIRSSHFADVFTYAGTYDVAANVLSINSHIVPVGVQVKKAGTYTFSMTTPFDGTVTLIDYHTGSRTNLGWSDYTVTLEKGTINDRFALEINIQNVSTDVEGNTGHFKGKDAVKFLHNGILYIKKGDAIYDARGSRVSMSYEL